MGAATATLVGMGASALTKGISAGVQARRAAERARNAQRALDNFENNRQAVINPYAGVEDVSEELKCTKTMNKEIRKAISINLMDNEIHKAFDEARRANEKSINRR